MGCLRGLPIDHLESPLPGRRPAGRGGWTRPCVAGHAPGRAAERRRIGAAGGRQSRLDGECARDTGGSGGAEPTVRS